MKDILGWAITGIIGMMVGLIMSGLIMGPTTEIPDEKIIRDKIELQQTYNKLQNDYYSCFMVDFCGKYPKGCLEYLEVQNLTAQEAIDYYSFECEASLRDWKEYQSKNTELKAHD